MTRIHKVLAPGFYWVQFDLGRGEAKPRPEVAEYSGYNWHIIGAEMPVDKNPLVLSERLVMARRAA